MKTMTVSDAARNFSEFVNRVHSGGEGTLLVKGGMPMVKVIPARRAKLGRELADVWPKLPHLSLAEATAFEADIAEARRKLPPVSSKWD
jgi:prevent-host-death family protein